MNTERTAYILLAIAFVGSLILGVTEIVAEDARGGFLVLAALAGFGLLVAKAYFDRQASVEDDHYDQTVER